MAADIKHTLLNLEVAPPAAAWTIIAARLDTEFDSSEIKVSEKIAEFEVAPPAGAWQYIVNGLEEEPSIAAPIPVRNIRPSFRRYATATAAVIVLALGGWYTFNNFTAVDSPVTQVPEVKEEKNTALPQNQSVAGTTLPVIDQPVRPIPRRAAILVASVQKGNERPDNDLPEVFSANLPPAGLQNIQSISASPTPNVEAPPIRDATGNIILDKDLLFAPDNNYIVVTGPNGEQTRISSKFLPLLGSLNGNSEKPDYFQFFLNENNIWKLRFNEWRDKMLRQASFIPTATNLLDLLELNDILQEN